MSAGQILFGDDSDDDSNFDPSSNPLPFPKPLDRNVFFQSDFSAADFLSSLSNRFQTLDDLQTELQDLLKSLNKELVDLVNDNYTDFLSLGEKLKGGEERIEEVRVGLLGFQRDVTGVRDLIVQRTESIKELLEEKRLLRRDIRTGRTLLEIDERLGDLEGRLGIENTSREARSMAFTSNEPEHDEQIGDFKDWAEDWIAPDDLVSYSDEEENASINEAGISSSLKHSLDQLQILHVLSKRCNDQHPFILAQRDRVTIIKDQLKRDLEAAIRRQPDVTLKQKIITIRRELDED